MARLLRHGIRKAPGQKDSERGQFSKIRPMKFVDAQLRSPHVASLHFQGLQARDITKLRLRARHGQRPWREPNEYDPANAWTDEKGYLHLRMAQRNGHWTCAEVSLNRSLGYGTYRFVVQDTAHLRPSAVLGLFTWGDIRQTPATNWTLNLADGATRAATTRNTSCSLSSLLKTHLALLSLPAA